MVSKSAVILAAGEGKRMKSQYPKVLSRVLFEPMLDWVIDSARACDVEEVCVVVGHGCDKVIEHLDERYTPGKIRTVFQEERLGTGHAVMQAEAFLRQNIDGHTLVLCGDAPFVDARTIRDSFTQHLADDASVTVISARVVDPSGYGRIVRKGKGIQAIVEHKDATVDQRQIDEINSGAFWFKTRDLIQVLGTLTNNNAQGEYYLTDAVSGLIGAGKAANAFIASNADVVLGANDRVGLHAINEIARNRIISEHMQNGVDFVCNDGIIITHNVKIGCDTMILPGTVIRGDTVIESDCIVGPNAVLDDCFVGRGAHISHASCKNCSIEPEQSIGPYEQWVDGHKIK